MQHLKNYFAQSYEKILKFYFNVVYLCRGKNNILFGMSEAGV